MADTRASESGAQRLEQQTPRPCAAITLSAGRREGGYWLVGDVRQYAGPQPCSCACKVSPKQAGAQPASGPTQPPGSMVTCSTCHRGKAAGLGRLQATSLDEARSVPQSTGIPRPEPDRHRSRATGRSNRISGGGTATVRHVVQADFSVRSRRNVSPPIAALRLCTDCTETLRFHPRIATTGQDER